MALPSLPYELLQGGMSVYPEKDGQIRIDAVAAYAQTPYAYTEHYSGSTAAVNPMAAAAWPCIRRQGLKWDCAETAPSLNYRMCCEGGDYTVWTLVKFNSNQDSQISAAIDHAVLPEEALYRGGQAFGATRQSRFEMDSRRCLPYGRRRTPPLTVYCLASGLRIDRICLTKGESIPPLDKD